MKNLAVIPARYGSKRLPKKNLRTFAGTTLLEHAILRAQAVFDDNRIYVNGDHQEFREIALRRGVNYYSRPPHLGSDSATSEEFVADFLENIECDFVFQLHSITPLLTSDELKGFVEFVGSSRFDTVLSGVEESLECLYLGEPINFTMEKKENSQDLDPVFRITWPVSAWRRETFLDARKRGMAGTYSGDIGYYAVSSQSGLPIKTQADLELIRKLNEAGEA